jgi:hypothetical protein
MSGKELFFFNILYLHFVVHFFMKTWSVFKTRKVFSEFEKNIGNMFAKYIFYYNMVAGKWRS